MRNVTKKNIEINKIKQHGKHISGSTPKCFAQIKAVGGIIKMQKYWGGLY